MKGRGASCSGRRLLVFGRGRPSSLSMATQEESQPSLLIVLTGADHWTLADGTQHPTGFWAEELIEPMRVFRDAGVDVTIATPGGVRPTVDEASLSAEGVGGQHRADDLREQL